MKSRQESEWFEDEALWRDLFPYMFPETRFSGAREEMDLALKLARPRGKAALDLCCGPGRCSIALAKRGFKVTGVDRTMFFLRKAGAAARRARVKIRFVRRDMRDFLEPNSFDLAVSMFTSFGYFREKGDDLKVLKNLHASLKPGGVLLMELMGKERLCRIFSETITTDFKDGALLIQRHKIVDDWTRIRNEWILIKNKRVQRFPFDLTIYSGQELKDRLESAGFKQVTLYGSLDGDAYGLESRRLIAVGRKPKRGK